MDILPLADGMAPVGVAAGMANMASIVSGKIMEVGVEVEVGASIASGMIDWAKFVLADREVSHLAPGTMVRKSDNALNRSRGSACDQH